MVVPMKSVAGWRYSMGPLSPDGWDSGTVVVAVVGARLSDERKPTECVREDTCHNVAANW